MKKLFSFFMALCLVASLGSVTAFAATDVSESTIIGEFDGLLGNYLDANSSTAVDESQQAPIIIGEFDGLLADYLDPSVPMPTAVANVRINSYYFLIKSFNYPVSPRDAGNDLVGQRTNGIAQSLNHLFQSSKYLIMESSIPEFFPNLFNRIHFRRIWWDIKKDDIVGQI